MNRPVIYFDWDGTLADSMALCYAEVSGALKELGYPVPNQATLALCNGPTIQQSVSILGIREEDAEAYFQARCRQEIELVPAYQKLFPGIEDMLRRLKERADLAIVSNGFDGYIRASVTNFGLDDCFVRIQAAIPGRSKTEILAQMIREMQPSRAAMVGDREGDIRAGLDNSLPTFGASFGFGSADELEGSAVVDSVEALEAALNAWLDAE